MNLAVVPILLLLALTAGCSHRATRSQQIAATNPTTSSASVAGTSFRDTHDGFSVTYPTGWKSRMDDNAENVLVIDPDGKTGGAELAIAVPKLPPHIPGVIPLPAVEKGYIDDVKKRLKEVKVLESTPTKVQGAYARRFVMTGKDKNGTNKLAVLAIVKGDHLYIVSAEAPMDDFAGAQSAFEAISSSWKWIEK